MIIKRNVKTPNVGLVETQIEVPEKTIDKIRSLISWDSTNQLFLKHRKIEPRRKGGFTIRRFFQNKDIMIDVLFDRCFYGNTVHVNNDKKQMFKLEDGTMNISFRLDVFSQLPRLPFTIAEPCGSYQPKHDKHNIVLTVDKLKLRHNELLEILGIENAFSNTMEEINFINGYENRKNSLIQNKKSV